MSQDSISASRVGPRWGRSVRWWMGVIALLALPLSFWATWMVPIRRHSAWYRRVEYAIDSLALRRPPEISRGEWQYVVGWTHNAHGNCASARVFMLVSQAELDRFETELNERLQSRVDIATIDWIWDEYERISRVGPVYSERFRPTRPDRLAEASRSNFVDIVVP